MFLNVKNGKKIKVSRFTIDLTHADLTGIVNGNPQARVPLFRLDLSHARLAAGKHIVTARGIGLTITAAAARAPTPRWEPSCSPPDSLEPRTLAVLGPSDGGGLASGSPPGPHSARPPSTSTVATRQARAETVTLTASRISAEVRSAFDQEQEQESEMARATRPESRRSATRAPRHLATFSTWRNGTPERRRGAAGSRPGPGLAAASGSSCRSWGRARP